LAFLEVEVTDIDEGASLPADLATLALGVPDRLEIGLPDRPAPGMLYALSLEGGIAFGPKEGRSIVFGRNRDEVHVCLGGNDRAVSREHGRLTHRAGSWWVNALGRTPVRLPPSSHPTVRAPSPPGLSTSRAAR
jgi:hypothetical protein